MFCVPQGFYGASVLCWPIDLKFNIGVRTIFFLLMESRTNLYPPCIIVHGGAWAIPESLKEPSINGVKRAAKTGYDRLIEV